MHTNPETEAISDSSRPRERPIHLVTGTTPAGRRASGEGAPLRAPPATKPVRAREHEAARTSNMQRFLRHRLTSPEKRTVKRIQAQRLEHFGAPVDSRQPLEQVRAQILQILRDDRGLAQGLDASAYDTLATWLVDEPLAAQTAAEIVGLFLREVGAMERPELSAPRVKSALRLLNEELYGEAQTGAIARGVREFRLEKRDGGLQVVGILRNAADEAAVARECRALLTKSQLGDIDLRLVSRTASPPTSTFR